MLEHRHRRDRQREAKATNLILFDSKPKISTKFVRKAKIPYKREVTFTILQNKLGNLEREKLTQLNQNHGWYIRIIIERTIKFFLNIVIDNRQSGCCIRTWGRRRRRRRRRRGRSG
jgi:hypothetical protein